MKRFISMLLIYALMLSAFPFSAFAIELHTHDDCEDVCKVMATTDATPASLLGEICPECGESSGSLYCDGDKIILQENIGHHSTIYGTCYFIVYESTSSYMCGLCGHQWPYPGGARHYCDEYHEKCYYGEPGIKGACTLKYSPPFEFEPIT